MKKIFSSKAKRNLIILTIFIVIVIIVFSIFYKTSSNIEKERKQIKYDSNMISMYIDGEMVNSLDSTKKYNLVNYMCANEETVTWDLDTYSLSVTPLTKKSKCILYFEKIPTIYDKILADNPTIKNDSADLFANVADEASESGLFRTTDLTKTEDTDGDGIGEEVLYFRGVVENNYLVFGEYQSDYILYKGYDPYAGETFFYSSLEDCKDDNSDNICTNFSVYAGNKMCWRIVRTNESGNSIKLRYGGAAKTINGVTTCPQTGTEVSIIYNNDIYFSFSYNYGQNDPRYMKWVYEEGMDSNAKTIVETWYTENIESQGTAVTNLIKDEPYCSDMTVEETQTNSRVFYGLWSRLVPQYKCPQESYMYSVRKGNINKPIALLTADELNYAGGGSSNTSYYLYTNSWYWLMSPLEYYGSNMAHEAVVSDDGSVGNILVTIDYMAGYIPAISIDNNAIVESSGTGEYNNPYVIVTN